MNFDQWWNEDYDDKDNSFEKDSFGYWAYAGWCAALAQPEQNPEHPLDIYERAYFAGKQDGIDETIALLKVKTK